MSAAFTPGPWALAEGAHPYSPPAKVIALPDGTVIAEALGNDGDWPESEAEVTANARLIASAPERYEALDAVSEELLLDGQLQEIVESALAKARGETL